MDEKDAHIWVSLKDYFERRLLDMETATNLARESMEYRLQEMNNFRKQIEDERANLLTKAEYSARNETVIQAIDRLADRIRAIELSRTEANTKIGLLPMVISILAILSSIILGILYMLKP